MPNITKVVYIVYSGDFDLSFRGADADVVEKALFNAEAAGALGTFFEVDGTKFNVRTDKYLYWTVSYEEAGF